MRLALLSDIHANVTALNAVLEEVGRRHVDKFVLLGVSSLSEALG